MLLSQKRFRLRGPAGDPDASCRHQQLQHLHGCSHHGSNARLRDAPGPLRPHKPIPTVKPKVRRANPKRTMPSHYRPKPGPLSEPLGLPTRSFSEPGPSVNPIIRTGVRKYQVTNTHAHEPISYFADRYIYYIDFMKSLLFFAIHIPTYLLMILHGANE